MVEAVRAEHGQNSAAEAATAVSAGRAAAAVHASEREHAHASEHAAEKTSAAGQAADTAEEKVAAVAAGNAVAAVAQAVSAAHTAGTAISSVAQEASVVSRSKAKMGEKAAVGGAKAEEVHTAEESRGKTAAEAMQSVETHHMEEKAGVGKNTVATAEEMQMNARVNAAFAAHVRALQAVVGTQTALLDLQEEINRANMNKALQKVFREYLEEHSEQSVRDLLSEADHRVDIPDWLNMENASKLFDAGKSLSSAVSGAIDNPACREALGNVSSSLGGVLSSAGATDAAAKLNTFTTNASAKMNSLSTSMQQYTAQADGYAQQAQAAYNVAQPMMRGLGAAWDTGGIAGAQQAFGALNTGYQAAANNAQLSGYVDQASNWGQAQLDKRGLGGAYAAANAAMPMVQQYGQKAWNGIKNGMDQGGMQGALTAATAAGGAMSSLGTGLANNSDTQGYYNQGMQRVQSNPQLNQLMNSAQSAYGGAQMMNMMGGR